MQRPSRFLLAAALLAAAACGGGGDDGGPSGPNNNGNPGGNPGTGSTSNAISVNDNAFNPSATTVAPGTTVTWTWAGSNPHNVTFEDNVASATQATGNYSRTFASAGSFPYRCTVHAGMSGTVTVR